MNNATPPVDPSVPATSAPPEPASPAIAAAPVTPAAAPPPPSASVGTAPTAVSPPAAAASAEAPVAPPQAMPPLGMPVVAATGAAPVAGNPPWLLPALGIVALLAGFAAWTAWDSREQARGLELELVRRQQGSSEQASEARAQSKQAQELARDAAAKVALLEAKLADVTLQRSQLEELVQSLSRSRDENVVADIDASVRVAMQQSALSGSAEPLMAALRTADERLGRINQPRLERLRRAVVRDLDRVRSAGVPDVGALLIKLDEAVRLADELPLTVQAAHQATQGLARPAPAAPVASGAARKVASGAVSGEGAVAAWQAMLDDWGRPLQSAWAEVRALLRVTRIDHPEAMLLAPEQGFFLRENLKLRLLNARLSLLSRQAEVTVSDLQQASNVVQAYFDGGARKTQLLLELLRQVQGQSRQLGVPRPDETLAATTTTAAAAVAR